MAILGSTRKNLWAKSGNRCSICQIKLFSQQTEKNEVNIGEECHIISSKPNGPRHKPGLSDYDLLDNLILLCRNHHKQIDELTNTFTEEVLRYIKQNHENWVNSTLNEAISHDKNNEPKFLSRITSGKELLNIVSNSYGYETDYDEIENSEEAEYIGGILQTLIDYGEISDSFEAFDKVKAGHQLNELLKELEEKGYYLFGEKFIKKMKFKAGQTDNWPVAALVIKKKENSEIITIDLKEK
jgi:hypothetical protein